MSDQFAELIAAQMASARERSDLATSVYDALKSTGKLASHRVLTYRCRVRRCVLLEVLLLPQGYVLASPRYKLSPSMNDAASSPLARAERTEDGDRRWKARAVFAGDALSIGVRCDHLPLNAISMPDLAADLEAKAAEVLIPRIA